MKGGMGQGERKGKSIRRQASWGKFGRKHWRSGSGEKSSGNRKGCLRNWSRTEQRGYSAMTLFWRATGIFCCCFWGYVDSNPNPPSTDSQWTKGFRNAQRNERTAGISEAFFESMNEWMIHLKMEAALIIHQSLYQHLIFNSTLTRACLLFSIQGRIQQCMRRTFSQTPAWPSCFGRGEHFTHTPAQVHWFLSRSDQGHFSHNADIICKDLLTLLEEMLSLFF